MTDKAAVKEIARQEKRFAAANCGRGVSAISGIVPDVVVGGICLRRKAKKNDKAQKNHLQCHRTAAPAITADNRSNRWQ